MRSEKSHVPNLYTYINNFLQTILDNFERKTTVFLTLIIIFNYFILASADFHIDRFVSLVFVAHMNRKLCMFRQNHGNLLHQQLQQKQFKICHSPHHPTPPWPPNMAAEQDSKEKVNSSMSVKSTPSFLTDAERRNRKTVSLLRPGAAQHNPIMHLFRWHISLVSLSLGKKGRSLGYEAAATNQSRQQEGKKKCWCWRTGTLEYWVCACVWIMSKLSLFTTVEKTVRFSQKNTVTSFICFFFSFQFILFFPPLVAAAALSSNGGRASVCFCSSGPSDDLKGLLQLHDQLPIRFLHLVSEPVLQSVDWRPCDLKQKQRGR